MPADLRSVPVRRNEERNRFELADGDLVAFADYMITKDGRIVFTHTEVPRAWEGQGVGSRLAKTGLAYAREHALKVMPLCPFFAGYIRRHREEYQHLLAPGFRV
ncbi:MAG: GNAT family N-acetyltransferase [Bacteroidota bacterium]